MDLVLKILTGIWAIIAILAVALTSVEMHFGASRHLRKSPLRGYLTCLLWPIAFPALLIRGPKVAVIRDGAVSGAPETGDLPVAAH